MIRSIAFVLAVSAARDPIAALRTQVVPVDPAVVHDTNRPPHLEPFRSYVYSPADIHLGAWRFRNALRMTPGVVIDDHNRIWIHGTPLEDGSLMLDGVRMLGTPTAFP